MNDLNEIVFYDGECGLCQRSINILMKCDNNKILKFAPLNGESYLMLKNSSSSNLETVEFYKDKTFFIKSDAFFEILKSIKGPVLVLFIFKWLLPKNILDSLYDFVAKRRQNISCMIISKDSRFLK